MRRDRMLRLEQDGLRCRHRCLWQETYWPPSRLYITFLVVKDNTFSAANIKVFKDQKVISTGPYAAVRHPMYSGTLLLTLASPLALGSWWGFLPVLLVIPMLVWRIFDEEKLLNAELPGYLDYARRVRYCLVPLGW